MTRESLVTAVQEGLPFEILMADGEKYLVEDAFRIALTKTNAIVCGDDDSPRMLPFLTMTGIRYLQSA